MYGAVVLWGCRSQLGQDEGPIVIQEISILYAKIYIDVFCYYFIYFLFVLIFFYFFFIIIYLFIYFFFLSLVFVRSIITCLFISLSLLMFLL